MSRRTSVRDPGPSMSLALRLANRDYAEPQIVAALLQHDEATLELQRSAGAERAGAYATKTARRALRRVQTDPAGDRISVAVRIAMLRDDADTCPWPGRTGPTDRRVLEAGFVTAELAHSATFGCSSRTWSLRVGLPRSVVSESVGRLATLGALEVAARSGPNLATRYHLRSVSCSRTGSSSQEEISVRVDAPLQAEGSNVWLSHDAFRALGDAAWLTLRWLSPEEARRACAIASSTGMDRRRVYAALGGLQGGRIAIGAPDGWLRACDVVPLLDQVAERAGTAGALEADRRQYEAERAAYRGSLSVREHDTGELVVATLDAVSRALELKIAERAREEAS